MNGAGLFGPGSCPEGDRRPVDHQFRPEEPSRTTSQRSPHLAFLGTLLALVVARTGALIGTASRAARPGTRLFVVRGEGARSRIPADQRREDRRVNTLINSTLHHEPCRASKGMPTPCPNTFERSLKMVTSTTTFTIGTSRRRNHHSGCLTTFRKPKTVRNGVIATQPG
jgi:hypothetical protein